VVPYGFQIGKDFINLPVSFEVSLVGNGVGKTYQAAYNGQHNYSDSNLFVLPFL